jgi:hypothetical protein
MIQTLNQIHRRFYSAIQRKQRSLQQYSPGIYFSIISSSVGLANSRVEILLQYDET